MWWDAATPPPRPIGSAMIRMGGFCCKPMKQFPRLASSELEGGGGELLCATRSALLRAALMATFTCSRSAATAAVTAADVSKACGESEGEGEGESERARVVSMRVRGYESTRVRKYNQ